MGLREETGLISACFAYSDPARVREEGGGGMGEGGGSRPVSFLPGCPECQLNLLKRQTSGPITLLLAPITHKKTNKKKLILKKSRARACCVCCQRVLADCSI